MEEIKHHLLLVVLVVSGIQEMKMEQVRHLILRTPAMEATKKMLLQKMHLTLISEELKSKMKTGGRKEED